MIRKLFPTPERDEILNGNVFKTMVKIGGPAVISSILFTVYNLVDVAWIGRLPKDEVPFAMAGMGISWPIFWLFVAFIGGFAGATVGALVAQNIGAGRPKEATFALNQLLGFAAGAGLLVGVAGYFIAPAFISAAYSTPEIVTEASNYIRIVFLGMPLMLLPNLLFFAYSSTGDTVTPLLVTTLGVGTNIILDPFFILGWAGLPQMGVRGAAYATLISQSVSVAVFLFLLVRSHGPVRLDRTALLPRLEWMGKALRIGLPAGAGQSLVAVGFVILTKIIDGLPDPATAHSGYNLANRIFGLLFIATNGLGIGLSTMIGQALGANRLERAKEVMKKGVTALFIVLVVEAAAVYLFRFQLISMFAPEQEEIIREAARFIELFAAGMPFLGAFFAAEAVFRGSGHNLLPMFIGIGRVWALRLPLAYVFAFVVGLQADGVWLGMSLSNVISGIVSIFALTSRKWQRARVETADAVTETAS